ncbi:MAG: HAD family phosphatase [Acidobacteriota bacterium]|jgi:HAD superfamily hydrolase (TIGR01509 family)|nr:HAD family phosphatase [Acidobacteriota bacterium]
MENIRAVIFDMDGVLIDAKDWHYDALNRALNLFGFGISRYDHLVTYDGLPTKQKLEMLSLEKGLPRALHAFINELKQKYTLELVHARCNPVFHHEYALSRLKALGYKLAVASNSVRDSVMTMLSKANLLQYFDVVLSNQDVVKSKPHPEIYLTAAASLGFQPRQCLVVEDNENGIQAAKAADANLFVVQTPQDVTFSNIMEALTRRTESGGGGDINENPLPHGRRKSGFFRSWVFLSQKSR